MNENNMCGKINTHGIICREPKEYLTPTTWLFHRAALVSTEAQWATCFCDQWLQSPAAVMWPLRKEVPSVIERAQALEPWWTGLEFQVCCLPVSYYQASILPHLAIHHAWQHSVAQSNHFVTLCSWSWHCESSIQEELIWGFWPGISPTLLSGVSIGPMPKTAGSWCWQ